MMRRTRRTVPEDELFPELVNVLVEGWGGPTRDDSPRSFDVFLLSEDDLREIAHRHRDVLQREAQRRGLARAYYAEPQR